MSKRLAIVAQSAMDLYLQNYRSSNDFFDLTDFIFHVGNAVSASYLTFYMNEYQTLRTEKKDEFITFDTSWLEQAVLTVKADKGKGFIELDQPVMSFPYDKSLTGVQLVVDDNTGREIERATLQTLWQMKYLPVTDRTFFYGDTGLGCDVSIIRFDNKGVCGIKKVRIYYIPSVSETMNIPEGIIETVITTTVNMMRQAADKVVIKKSLDGNQNKMLQTEMDKEQMK